MKKVLVMTFEDDQGKPFSLRVNDPKEELSGQEVAEAMNDIMSANVFPKEGSLTKVVTAELVSTTVESLFDYGG